MASPPTLTPQLLSGAPEKLCPRCGRRMQLLQTTPSTRQYVCFHSSIGEPYYLNVHFCLKEDGSVPIMGEKKDDGEKDEKGEKEAK